MTTPPQTTDREPLVGMVAAYRTEVAPLLHRAPNLRRAMKGEVRLSLPMGAVVLVISGAGMDNARNTAEALVNKHRLLALISIGFAGGLTDEAAVGNVLLANNVIDAASGTSYPCARGLFRASGELRGPLVTVPAVAATRAEKAALQARWGAMAADMEAAAVAQAATAAGLPFGAVKAMTDGPADELAIDFHRCLTDNGGLSSVKIVIEGLRGMGQFRSLLLLARNSRLAAGSLARVLAGA